MNTKEMSQWLRENSSGSYRAAADAADMIDALVKKNAELERKLTIEQDKYKKLASHHNSCCTCMESY